MMKVTKIMYITYKNFIYCNAIIRRKLFNSKLTNGLYLYIKTMLRIMPTQTFMVILCNLSFGIASIEKANKNIYNKFHG